MLGFPCNQFGAQEPGNEQEIATFCETNYGVTFPMFAQDRRQRRRTPRRSTSYLKSAKPGLLGTEAIKWNFTKFLVDREGSVVARYRTERRRRESIAARHREGACEDAPMVAARWLAVAAARVAARLAASAVAGGTAHAGKVLRVSFPVAETGFDPQAAGDIYSNYVNRAIFDPLYRYDYLARPYKLVPNTAAAHAGDLGRRQDVDDPRPARASISPTIPRSRASGAS